MTETNPRLAAALAYAARGWHVFPCLPRLKIPEKDSKGFHQATTDEARIRAWWSVNPNYNVAISTGPSNLLVVDVDPGGEAAWEDMLACDPDLQAAAETCRRVRSPRGTLHYYFENPEALGTSGGRLHRDIDTRGIGGYVLAPPSYVDDGKSKGGYTLEQEGSGVFVPAYLAEKLRRRTDDTPPVILPASDFDAPEAISRATAYLQGRVDAAARERDTVHQTFETACVVLEMGVSPAKAFDLMATIWNPHRTEPWADNDLKTKIKNAWTYGQETKGGKAERPIAETFAHFVEPLDEPEQEPNAVDLPERYTPMFIEDAIATWKPPEWLIPGVMTKTGVGLLYGPPATLKTFLMLDLASSIATGHGPNWWAGDDREPETVLYLAGESPNGLVNARYSAWMQRHMIPGLRSRSKLIVVPSVPPLEMSDYWRGIIEWIRRKELNVSLLVIDTVARAMAGWDENSGKDVTKTTMKMESLSRELGCFVMGIHHTGKDAERGARGSSAWHGNTDLMLEVERPSKGSLDVLIHPRKVKEAADGELPFMFKGGIYGDAPSFERDWDFKPETPLPNKVIEQRESEEWLGEKAIYEELAKGPHTLEHLVLSLSRKFGVDGRAIRAKLKKAGQSRYKALVLEGDIWTLPASHPVKQAFNEEQF